MVALVATLLGCVTTFPLILHLDSSIYGTPGDSTGTIAIFWWWAYAVQHGKPILDNTMWGVPFGADWGQRPFAVLPLVLFTPLTLAFGSITAWNLATLASFPLTAVFTYLLARRLTLSPLGAAFGALAFSFIPYHQEKATGHMFQAHMELFPALLLLLFRWRTGGSRWNLLGAGAVLGLGVWIDYEFAFIMIFAAAAFFIVSTLSPRQNGTPFRHRLGQHLSGALTMAAAVLPFLPPAVLLGHRPGSGTGYARSVIASATLFPRNLGDIDIYSVRPWEYFLPWSANPLLPGFVRNFEAHHLHGSNGVEQAQFLGYTVIALALVALAWFRPRFPVLLGLSLVIVGGLLALPAHVHLWDLVLPGPAAFLNHIVPFFRVYARFGLLVMLGATLLAGLGFSVYEGLVRGHHAGWLVALPFLLLAVEFNAIPPTHTTTLLPAPDEYLWLRDQPSGILIEYPVVVTNVEIEIQNSEDILYQQIHLHPLFNGAGAKTRAAEVAPTLDPYYGPGVAARLRALGIRYVFVHRHDYAAAGYRLPQTVDGFDYVGSYYHGDVEAFVVSGNAGG